MAAGTLWPVVVSVSTVHCSTRSPSNSLQETKDKVSGKKKTKKTHTFNQHRAKQEREVFLFTVHQRAKSHPRLTSVPATYLWMAFPPKGNASQAGRIGVHS